VGGTAASEDYVNVIKGYESERIRLLDYVYGEGLEELWSNAYLVVQPSTMEGLSIALLEALSYGRCVLLSDIPENLEVAEECAVPFRSRDVEDLRARLETLLRDPALVRSYEAKAKEHIRQHYSWDRVAKNTEAVYLELLGGGRRRG
jgi:glycosyltransferase involved in cell wall biosynthesis